MHPFTIKQLAGSTGGLQLQSLHPLDLSSSLNLVAQFLIDAVTYVSDAPSIDLASVPYDAGVDPSLLEAGSADSGASCTSSPPMTKSPSSTGNGVDVSHYQPSVDWPTVHTTKTWAFSKATEGTSYIDNTFAKNFPAMKSAGLARGGYHFFRASKDARAQASFFVKTLIANGYDPATDLAPMLDVEVTDGQSASAVIQGVHTFLDEAQQQLGVTLLIYTGPSFWTSTLGNPDFSANPLWIAHYTSAPKPKIPSTWSNYAIWQFSETQPVPGINSGGADNDRWGAVASVTPDAGNGQQGTGQCADAGDTDGGDASGLIPGTCTHDVCTAGERLGQACDSCTMQVCAVDPYCCDTLWGPSCFYDVAKYCGRQCP